MPLFAVDLVLFDCRCACLMQVGLYRRPQLRQRGCWCCTRGWSSSFTKTREWYHTTCHDIQSDLDPIREYLKEAVGVVGWFVLVLPRAAGSVYCHVLNFANYFFSSECCHDNRRCESLILRQVGLFYQQRRFIRDRFIQRKSSWVLDAFITSADISSCKHAFIAVLF